MGRLSARIHSTGSHDTGSKLIWWENNIPDYIGFSLHNLGSFRKNKKAILLTLVNSCSTNKKHARLACRECAPKRNNLALAQTEIHRVRAFMQCGGLQQVRDDADTVRRRLWDNAALDDMIAVEHVSSFNKTSLAFADAVHDCRENQGNREVNCVFRESFRKHGGRAVHARSSARGRHDAAGATRPRVTTHVPVLPSKRTSLTLNAIWRLGEKKSVTYPLRALRRRLPWQRMH